jgi:hypothetical protein
MSKNTTSADKRFTKLLRKMSNKGSKVQRATQRANKKLIQSFFANSKG